MPQIAQQDYIRIEVDFASISGYIPPEINNQLFRALKSGTIFDVILSGPHPSSGEMSETRILGWEPYNDSFTLHLIIPGFGGMVTGINVTAPIVPDDDEPIPEPKDNGGIK